MILYASRFLYSFYGLILVSGCSFDVQNVSIHVCSKCKRRTSLYICNMPPPYHIYRQYGDFTYAKYSYFIDFCASSSLSSSSSSTRGTTKCVWCAQLLPKNTENWKCENLKSSKSRSENKADEMMREKKEERKSH